ncbi:hypothetical protein Tco_0731783 [Tanacetum coccineum]
MTRIRYEVKLHDVSIQVFEDDEADLVMFVTIGSPSLSEDDFYQKKPSCVELLALLPDKTYDGFQIGWVKRRKGKESPRLESASSVLLEHWCNSSKKDNLSMSNSFSALNEEEDEEDVENVYDESANLIQNTKAGGSSSFTAAAG